MNYTKYQTALVLEGGGMRSLYTAGILDCFLDNGIEIKNCYGVSAGAMCGMNYIAKQKERTYRTVVNYIHDKSFCSIRSLLMTGNLFGADMLYNRIPNELDPFDYDTFAKSDSRLTLVCSNVMSAKPTYHMVKDMRIEISYLQASCSLPIVSRKVKIGDQQYLDGGITDSIPLAKAIEDGNKKSIVILTQHRKYQKKPEGFLTKIIGKLIYARYPLLIKAGVERHTIYNKQLEFVSQQETNGKVLVLAPDKPVTIKRAEKNKEKLSALYQQGYNDALQRLDEIINFLQQE